MLEFVPGYGLRLENDYHGSTFGIR